METLRAVPILLTALAMSGPAGLTAQAADPPLDSAMVSWLVAWGVAADSVELVDTEPGGDLEVLILRVKDGGREEYWTASRPAAEPHAIQRLGTIPSHWTDLSIAIVRRPGGAWGGYRLRNPPYDPPGVRLLHPSVPQFRVVPGGLAEVRLGDTLFIPLDYPDFEHFRRSRPDHLAGASPQQVDISVEIGPVTDDGDRIWFGLTFYDGEGLDGVGGVGWFDPHTREAELIYPPEMADYSVSAISIEAGKLLLGLVIRPEEAIIGLGLARYDPVSGAFERILDEGHITGIATAEHRIFAVSDQGLLEIQSHNHAINRWQVLPPGGSGEAPPIVFSRSLPGR